MDFHRFCAQSLPVTPWKNGGGTTREITCWPAGAGLDTFVWRASIATIAEGGPFSVFPGVDRHIALLAGDGVRLRARDGSFAHRLDRPHEPFAFAGDLPLDCSLLGGVSSDFNIMSRRGRMRAQVRVLETLQTLAEASHGLLMSVRGTWRANGEALAQDEGLWWAETSTVWRLEPVSAGARLIAVRWSAPMDNQRNG